MGNLYVILECENEKVIDQVLNPDEDYDMFRKIMSEEWDLCDIIHISSSTNPSVVALTNEAIYDHYGLGNVVVPPSSILGILHADKMA